MNKYKFIVLLIILFPYVGLAQLNPELIQYKQDINPDTIKQSVEQLQNFGSRYAFNPNRVEVSNYLKNRLEQYGWEAKIDSFYMENFEYPYFSGIINTGWQYNVVADKRGRYAPDTFFVIGAHYDSYAYFDSLTYFHNSPGADDNASSVAAILEIARIFQKHNIQPTKTLRIEFYAAEELGLHGSSIAIQRSHYKFNEHISGMLNCDMIGYKSDPLSPDTVKLIYYDNSQELTDFAEQTTLNYTTLIPNKTTELNQYSDSWSYYSWGRRAIFLQESEFHPLYHTSNDLSTTLNYPYLSKIAELAFSIAYLASTTNTYYPISISEKPIPTHFVLKLNANPVKDNIKFTYITNTHEDPSFQIINQIGKIEITSKLSTYQTNFNKYQIPTHNLKSGIYYLRIENQIEKIVVIK